MDADPQQTSAPPPDAERAPVGTLAGAGLGALLGLVWISLIALGQAIMELPNPAFALFEGLTRVMPGDLVTAGLELMIGTLQALQLGETSSLGKTIESSAAYATALVGIAVLAGLHARWRREGGWVASGLASGLILGAASLLVEALVGTSGIQAFRSVWLLVLGLGWGLGLEQSLRWLDAAQAAEADPARRAVLVRIAAGAVAVSGVGGLLAWLGRDAERTGVGARGAPILEATPTPEPFRASFQPVEGTRPEISALDEFYRVDITLTVPQPGDLARAARSAGREAGMEQVPEADHFVLVDGLVDRPRFFTLEEIKQLPRVDRFTTLSCISNNIAGDLIDTQLFSGARLGEVLEMTGLQPAARDIKFTSADGYTESLPVESAIDERTLLVYAMGGQHLTPEHGFPVRLFTPDRFGMKNPKWIVRIEAVPDDYRGYWEQRGWSEDAFVKTTSVIDVVSEAGEGTIVAGGIAYAGARGIAGVELRLDDGEWTPATLNRPLSDLTWVLWRAEISGEPGRHELTVRAIDGQGNVQTPQVSDSYPDGASGHHSRSVQIPGQA